MYQILKDAGFLIIVIPVLAIVFSITRRILKYLIERTRIKLKKLLWFIGQRNQYTRRLAWRYTTLFGWVRVDVKHTCKSENIHPNVAWYRGNVGISTRLVSLCVKMQQLPSQADPLSAKSTQWNRLYMQGKSLLFNLELLANVTGGSKKRVQYLRHMFERHAITSATQLHPNVVFSAASAEPLKLAVNTEAACTSIR